MDLQQCQECNDNYPLWMIICLDDTKICKICILSGQIKSNRDRMEGIRMDIDLITGKINELTMFVD